MIPRIIKSSVLDRWQSSNKLIVVYGPRQVGKTTLVKSIMDVSDGKCLYVNADLNRYHDVLESRDLSRLKGMLSGYDYFLLDEAQRVNNVGLTLKIIHDELPDLKVIATGSSSLDLASALSEAMTGRYWSYHLYPISVQELVQDTNAFEVDGRIEELLVYGSYPEVFQYGNLDMRSEYLKTLSSSYLYKDILELSGIRHANKVRDLLRLLSYQMGQLISFAELGRQLGLSTETVQHYVDLLEKSFVLKGLHGFSRNLRKEITKQSKYYFWDLGIRNAVIDDFKPLHLRNDKGALWENFLFIERQKYLEYSRQQRNCYYWRLYSGAELDYVEETSGVLHGYEFKWRKRNSKGPKSWQETYPDSTFDLIDRSNYAEFINP